MSKPAIFECGGEIFEGELISPRDAAAVILLAHGAGSGQFSPPNREVAKILRERGFATFLVDLETSAERENGSPSSDIVSGRIIASVDWLRNQAEVNLPLGILGAGTGAAAVVKAMTTRQFLADAFVSRGGKFDQVSHLLSEILAPTLLVVGSRDLEVVHTNLDSFELISAAEKRLQVIPGAQHNFEEPGTLAATALQAASWFERYLPAKSMTHVTPVGPESFAYGGL